MTEPIDFGALLAAEVARQDPMTRFVASLPNDEPGLLRSFAEQTLRLRREYEVHATRALTENYEAAVGHAEWLRKNAHDVVHRWCLLRAAAIQWAERDVQSLSFRLPL